MATKYQGTVQEKNALDTYIKVQRAANTLLNYATLHLQAHGLTISQFAVLEALYHLGTLSQRDLAEKLLKSTGNMTTVLKTMEKNGWIERIRDSRDNRYMRVSITPSGRELVERTFPPHVKQIMAALALLTPEEQTQLAALSRKLGLGIAQQMTHPPASAV